MNHNKNYFLLYTGTAVSNDGTGLVYNPMSIRSLLGQLYDKYNAFSIKLESIIYRNANYTATVDDFLLLHLEGLPFMNGYDTLPNYNNSRVMEMIDYSTVINGYNFLSACNGVNFWKPSTENITLKIFHTRISDGSLLINNDDTNFIFSITGLLQYKKINPEKSLTIKRFGNMTNSFLTLSTAKAISIDSKNRAWIFKNINLRQIIGSNYDKYKKFVLITKSLAYCEYNGTAYANTFSGYKMTNLLLSGFNFYRSSLMPNYPSGTTAQQTTINSIHTSPPCVICQTYYNGTTNAIVCRETYIENIFEKSQDTIDITISQTTIYGYYLVPNNAASSNTFPHFIFNFDIIPLEE